MHLDARACYVRVKKRSTMSITVTNLTLQAAMAEICRAKVIYAVGKDRQISSYSSLSCRSPPATSLALSLSYSPEAVNYILRNTEQRITLSRSSRVRSETITPCHTCFFIICLSSARIMGHASSPPSRSAALTGILKAKSLWLSVPACRTRWRLILARLPLIFSRVSISSDVARATRQRDHWIP